MAWPGQDPPSTDVLLQLNVPCSDGGTPARLDDVVAAFQAMRALG